MLPACRLGSSCLTGSAFASDTLRRLQVAPGSLASSGRRNRYAVKDRFKVLAGLLDVFG